MGEGFKPLVLREGSIGEDGTEQKVAFRDNLLLLQGGPCTNFHILKPFWVKVEALLARALILPVIKLALIV